MGKIANPAGAPPPALKPKIYEATFGTGGDVVRGAELNEAQAVAARQARPDRDVVVCGQSTVDNRELAEKIEKLANGKCKLCPPHVARGPGALPHFQPDPRGTSIGHCFFETTKAKSKKARKP